jgi:hypothetical protein
MDATRKSQRGLQHFRPPSQNIKGSGIQDVYSHPYKVRANVVATTYIDDPSMEGYGDDYFIGWTLIFIDGDSGTNKTRGERYTITDYTSIGGRFTFAAGTNAPDVGDEYMLIPPVSMTHPYGFGGSVIWSVCTAAHATNTTTSYYDAQLEQFADDWFNDEWYLVPYHCAAAGIVGTPQLIIDFDKTHATGEGGIVAVASVGGAIAAGDVFMIVPKWMIEGGEGYMNYTPVSITFAAGTTGSVAEHEVLTVTGLCEVHIICECNTNVAGTGTICFGMGGDTDFFIAATTGTDIGATDVWHAAAPALAYAPVDDVKFKVVTNGVDIGYEVETNTLTSGVIVFHMWWKPLEPTAKCVAAAGAAGAI